MLTATCFRTLRSIYAGTTLFILMLLAPPRDAGAQFSGTADWDDRFMGRGLNGDILTLDADGVGRMYVGGRFERAGGRQVNKVALLNGDEWEALGTGIVSSISDQVYTLVVGDDGSVYVGGTFSQVGQPDGTPLDVHNVARWTGDEWESMGSGLNGTVYTLWIDEDGTLYAGGDFSMDGLNEFELGKVARWTGTSWSAVGDGLGTFSSVAIRAFTEDGEGRLVAGGSGLTGGLFQWNGEAWTSFGAGHKGDVYALAYEAETDALYAGGAFREVVQGDTLTIVANNIARWTAEGWSTLGSGLDGPVQALLLGNGGLLAGGRFMATDDASVALSHLGMWNGSAWSTLGVVGEGASDHVSALSESPDGTLYAGGRFAKAAGDLVNGLAVRASGAGWEGVGRDGMDGEVHAVVPAGIGTTYVGGQFTHAGTTLVNLIAKWNGAGWAPLGRGLSGSSVDAMAVDSLGHLYVGGTFEAALAADSTEVAVNNVAMWDGASWSALGDGLGDGVRALWIGPDGALYAGGAFTQDGAGNATLNRIAVWNGSTWSPLGDGLDGDVAAIAGFTGGDILVAGDFAAAGSVAGTSYLARWDGSAWAPFSEATTLDAAVQVLAVASPDTLYAGGAFTTVGDGVGVGYVARWTETGGWEPLGSPTNNGVSECCVTGLAVAPGGLLYVGGTFEGVVQAAGPDLQVNQVALWDGTWQALDGGTSGDVIDIAYGGATLYVGGNFQAAGGVPSTYLAAWLAGPEPVSAEPNPTPERPETFVLSDVYPNPFNPEARFTLSVATTQHVEVGVYDALGRRVRVLHAGLLSGGRSHTFRLDGGGLSSGVYLLRVTGTSFRVARAMVLLK